jgi:hypothetical protein
MLKVCIIFIMHPRFVAVQREVAVPSWVVGAKNF